MTTSSTTLSSWLGRFDAFRLLPPDDLDWLARRAKPFQCGLGQELLSPDRMPEYWYAVIEGRGRVLHQDPGLRRPVTLAYSNPGDLVGWAGLASRSPCEWITASQPMKLIGIKAEDFLELERRSEIFRSWLDSASSPAELMSVFSPALRQRPMADPAERDVLHTLLTGLRIEPARELRKLPDDDAVWLWNAQPDGLPVPRGGVVDTLLLADIPPGQPLRLVRV